MDEILAPIKQRILLIIDYKYIKKVDFFSLLGIASSNFRGKGLYSEAGGDVIAKILTTFTDISPEWLITGQGEMLRQLGQSTTSTAEAPPHQQGVVAVYKELLAEKDRQIQELNREVGRLDGELTALKEALVQRAGGGAPGACEQGSSRAAS